MKKKAGTKKGKTIKFKKPKKSKPVKDQIIHEEKIQAKIISDYVFSFELTKQYPTTRSYLMKKPLKRSFGESFFDLFGTKNQ